MPTRPEEVFSFLLKAKIINKKGRGNTLSGISREHAGTDGLPTFSTTRHRITPPPAPVSHRVGEVVFFDEPRDLVLKPPDPLEENRVVRPCGAPCHGKVVRLLVAALDLQARGCGAFYFVSRHGVVRGASRPF